MTDAERWGVIFKAARTGKLFLTQAEIAEKIEALATEAGVPLTVDQGTVSRWERGVNAPSLRARPFVAKAVDLTVAELFQQVAA